MQNAQIWKSIEALCDEAEAVIKDGNPMMAVVKSTAPPAMAKQQVRGGAFTKPDAEPDTKPHTSATIAILPSEPAPPRVTVIGKSSSISAEDTSLSNSTMAEIAAAIDRASKSSQGQIMDPDPQPISDQLRRDLMAEVSDAVRAVLAKELPHMVRHAVSDSLYSLLTVSSPDVGGKSDDIRQAALESRPANKKPVKKRATAKKAATKKAAAKKAAAKKAAAKKTAQKTTQKE
jgi:hypothetical protein